ncbi:MAG: hypothetical protein ACRYG8_31530 [Janthinobacterium lividum]
MTLAEVLALHPGQGADAATLAAALAAAQAKREELLNIAAEAEQVRAGGLLTVDDKKLQAAERDAGQARLAADRIGELLLTLRSDLGKAQGAQTVAELRAMVPAIVETTAASAKWWAEEFPKMQVAAFDGLNAYNAAREVRAAFLAKVEAAFRSQDVRSAAPDGLGVTLPPETNTPAPLFMFWNFKNG